MAIIIGKDSDNNLIGTNGDDWVFGLGGNDTLSGGNGSDKLFGGNGNDSIAGGAGSDWIVGGKGNDSLAGGSGADQLIGGSGQDHFVYLTATDSPAAAGWDRILDFTQGQDKIDLAAFRNNSSNLDLIWKGEDPAVPGAWGVWYHNGPTSTCVYADTNGDGVADLKIELKNTCGLNLVASDFIGVSEAQVNVAPVLDLDANNSAAVGTNYATTFTENGAPVAIADADVGITDVDDTHIVSASITLTNPQIGDSLVAGALPTGITVGGASTATHIILTGSATLADYQAALKAITFSNSSENPDTTARDVTVVVNDGDANSNTAHTAIAVVAVNDAPSSSDDSETTAEDTTFVLGLDDFGTYADIEGTAIAAVKITTLESNGSLDYDTAGDGSGWTAVLDDQVIGAADITAGRLRFVPDANENGTPYTTVGFQVSDGTDFSVAEYTLTLNVTAVNDAPTVAGLVVTETSISFVPSDVDNAVLSLASPFANAFGNPAITSDAITALTPAQQAPAVSGVLQVTDGTAGADVVGLYLGSSGSNVATAPLAGSPNAMYGFAGNDVFTGGTGADSLFGGTGNDELRQTQGADHLDGGAGNDRLTFNTGVTYGGVLGTGVNVDLEFGTSDYDTSDAGNPVGNLVSIENVTGTAGNDSLAGGDPTHAPDLFGNGVLESFRPLDGNDAITGATGNGLMTRVDYTTSTSTVAVNLGTTDFVAGMITVQGGTAHDGFGFIDTLVRVDQAYGGSGNDTLYGGGQERSSSGGFLEQFLGNSGNDTIDGAGTDTVVGAAGNDRVRYDTSPAAVIVNLGATDFVAGMVTVQSGTAHDGFGFIDNLRNIDQVLGSNSNDTLVGGNSDHSLIGGLGNDSLVGGTSGVEAAYQTSTAAVVANLEMGTASDGFGGMDTLVNIDDLRGSDFSDTLTGNADDNRIDAGGGADTIDGGGGIDFAKYSSTPLANGGINASIEIGFGMVNDGMGSIDMLSNIEGLIGTHSGDTLTGGSGDQWFIGRGGSDMINGGTGNDGVSYIDDPAGVTVNLGAPGSATDGWGGIWALGGTDTLISIENVEGSQFNDSITGDANANVLEGGAGNDSIDGGAGNDTIAMLVSPGNVDMADGGADTDTLALIGSPGGDGTVTVNLAAGSDIDQVTFANDALNQTQSNFENVDGSGLSSALNATGSNGANAIIGSNGSDTIKGGAGADSLEGGAGIDTLLYDDSPGRVIVNMFNNTTIAIGGVSVVPGTAFDGFGTTDTISGFENVVGSAFNDYIRGTSNVANRLEGGAGNDTLAGSGTGDSIVGLMDDTLVGGAGDDVLRQTRGHDSINGGDGFDRLEFVNNGINYRSVFGVSVNLGANTSDADGFNGDGVNGPGGDVAAVSGIEHVLGTAGADSLIGNAFANLLEGGAEDDTLQGGAGNDTIDGGDSNDRIVFSDATDAIDFTLVQSSSDTVVDLSAVGLGTDTYRNIEGVVGTSFNDTLTGSSADDRLEGGAGDDTIDGGAGSSDRIAFSGAAPINFTLVQSSSDTVVDLSAVGLGTDTYRNIEGVVGSSGNDTLTGSSGNDLLVGAGGNDSIDGVEGDDTLRGSGGNDTIDGGAGIDQISFSDGTAGLTFTIFQNSSDTVVNLNTIGRGIDTYRNIEGVIGTNFNDMLTGSAGNDMIDGGAGDNDTLRGGAGDDTIDGGAGNSDRIVFSDATGAIDFTLVQSSSDTVVDLSAVGLGIDTYRNIEMVVGTNFDDMITGSSADDRLEGGAGNDTIDGSAGNSDRIGFAGASAGINFTVVQSSSDTVVDLIAVGLGTDTYRNIEGVTSTDFNDTLTGSSGNDSINGAGGNDSINGVDGDDTLRGSGGNDTIDGGAGIDRLEFANATAGIDLILNQGTNPADPVNGLWSTGALPGGIGTDFYKNMEGVIGTEFIDTLTGSSLADMLQGGGGNDTIEGQGGSDTIKGGAGADSLEGGAGIDTLLYDDSPGRVIVNMFNNTTIAIGGVSVVPGTAFDGFGTTDTISGFENVVGSAFNDYIRGTSNVANRLEGGAGNDTLAGSGTGDSIVGLMDDTLVGGAGDDVLRQTRGHDSINGGDGFDRLEFVNNGINYRSVFGVSVNLGANTSDADGFNGDGVNGPGGDVAAVSGIEHVLGTAGADSLIGNAFANLLEGGAEDDTLQGGAGNDTIDGGDSNDRIVFSDATDAIDFTLVQSSSDTVVDLSAVGLGTDTYRNIEGVVGTSFNDTLTGSSADDRLEGGAGDDTIDGGAGSSDRIAFSGAAPINFTLVQSSSDTVVDLSAVGLGTDTYRNIEGVVGSSGNDTLTGSSGNDLLVGAGGNDSIDGVEGDDTLRGSGGNDTIDGGAGIDQISFSDGTAGLTFTIFQNSSDTVVNLNTIGRGIDTYRNIEGVIGTNFNDMLTGSAGNDMIDGGAGDNDTLRGGAGDDTIDGGAGNSDRIVFSDATGAIDFTLVQSSSDTVVDLSAVGLGIDTYRNIEMVVGTNFDDMITGSSADDRLEGGAGNDTIDGSAGNSDRIGFAGASAGINFTVVQSSSDTVVDLIAVGLGTDTYRNIEGVTSTDFNDTLTGSSGNDSINGAGGNDSINGVDGDDTLRGSGGNDTIDGGAGIDRLEFANATAGIDLILNQGTNPADPVNGLWSTGALPGGIGTDFYKNMEGVIGTEFIDTLTGSSLADMLQGGGSADTMTGRAGTDTFKFVVTSDSSAALSFSDVITDFVHGTDKIDLSAIDANTAVDFDQAFAFVALANANAVANSVTWSEDVANIRTILQIDNNGDTAADMQIVLHGTGLDLTDADFIL